MVQAPGQGFGPCEKCPATLFVPLEFLDGLSCFLLIPRAGVEFLFLPVREKMFTRGLNIESRRYLNHPLRGVYRQNRALFWHVFVVKRPTDVFVHAFLIDFSSFMFL